ncbi:MAG TPA: thioredoxin family protein [Candidatus Eisenbacteria bacterium]|jgi:thioredoxin-related protein
MRSLRSALLALFSLFALLSWAPGAFGEDPAPRRPNRSATPAPGERKLSWLAFDAAATRATKEGKHVIIDVYTTWCGWCRVMERETYGNAEVADYLTRNFVLAKVNGESSSKIHWKGRELTERQFARETGVTGFPTTFFLKPDLDLLGGVPGYIRPNDFMTLARYVGTRWYQRGKLQDYIKDQQSAADSAR